MLTNWFRPTDVFSYYLPTGEGGQESRGCSRPMRRSYSWKEAFAFLRPIPFLPYRPVARTTSSWAGSGCGVAAVSKRPSFVRLINCLRIGLLPLRPIGVCWGRRNGIRALLFYPHVYLSTYVLCLSSLSFIGLKYLPIWLSLILRLLAAPSKQDVRQRRKALAIG